jgi:hypothetical protein
MTTPDALTPPHDGQPDRGGTRARRRPAAGARGRAEPAPRGGACRVAVGVRHVRPALPGTRLALATYARDGRARGVPVSVLLRALDTIVRPSAGGDAALDLGGARALAGTALIRAYYAHD